MTTVSAVARALTGGKKGRARTLLEHAVRSGALIQQGDFYRAIRRELSDRSLADAAAVLWFCCITSPTRPLLSVDQVEELTQSTSIGRSNVKHARLYLDPGDYLGLIRVEPRPSGGAGIRLNRSLRRLQAYVNQPHFLPWAHLASRGRLRLVYLIDDSERAAELRRWLAIHPLVSHERSDCTVIPCDVRLTRYMI